MSELSEIIEAYGAERVDKRAVISGPIPTESFTIYGYEIDAEAQYMQMALRVTARFPTLVRYSRFAVTSDSAMTLIHAQLDEAIRGMDLFTCIEEIGR